MRKIEIILLIPFSERGRPATTLPKEYGYFFTEAERQEILQDAKCNAEAFNLAVQEAEDVTIVTLPQTNEKWFISEKELQNSGLRNWQNRGMS